MVLDAGKVEPPPGSPLPYVRINATPLETLHDRVLAELLRPRRQAGVSRTTPLRIDMANGIVWLLPAADVDRDPPTPLFAGYIERAIGGTAGAKRMRVLELSTYASDWIPGLIRTLLTFGSMALPPIAELPPRVDDGPLVITQGIDTPMGRFV